MPTCVVNEYYEGVGALSAHEISANFQERAPIASKSLKPRPRLTLILSCLSNPYAANSLPLHPCFSNPMGNLDVKAKI